MSEHSHRKYAVIARRYLEGAKTLIEASPQRQRVLQLPTLMLTSHGLEVMLKGCLLLNGLTDSKVRSYGHKIDKMWELDEAAALRWHLVDAALTVTKEQRAIGYYVGIPEDGEVVRSIETYVSDLARLHGGGKYPLRYPHEDSEVAPRTPMIVLALYEATDLFVKRPNEFLLDEFKQMLVIHELDPSLDPLWKAAQYASLMSRPDVLDPTSSRYRMIGQPMRQETRNKAIAICDAKIAAKGETVGLSFYAFFANKNDDPVALMEAATWWIMTHQLDHFEKAVKVRDLLKQGI